MSIFIGIKRKAGDYEFEDEKTKKIKTGLYDNFYLHYIDEAELSGENLQDCSAYESFISKIKVSEASGVFGFDVKDCKQFDDWFLKPIDIFFNRKGNVTSVRLIEEKPSGKKAAQ